MMKGTEKGGAKQRAQSSYANFKSKTCGIKNQSGNSVQRQFSLGDIEH